MCRATFSPDSATASMGTPCSKAMKPSTEKMAKPATKLVPLFRQHSMRQSLEAGSHRRASEGAGVRGRGHKTEREDFNKWKNCPQVWMSLSRCYHNITGAKLFYNRL